jgi:hypothetical protein
MLITYLIAEDHDGWKVVDSQTGLPAKIGAHQARGITRDAAKAIAEMLNQMLTPMRS